MTDEFNDDSQINPFCRLQLMVETIEHSTEWTNQSKLEKVPKVALGDICIFQISIITLLDLLEVH